MAQHDYNIANQGFSSFRSDLNNALSAIQTTNSGTSLPTGAVAGQIWLDTTNATSPTLKFYDGTDSISLATINYTANTVDWLDSSVTITGLSTTATGTVLTLTDSASTSTVNLIIDNQKEVRFRETTANGTNYIGLKAPASVTADLTFTLPVAPTSNNQALISSTAGVMSYTPYSFPSSDGSANQVLATNGSGALSFATVSSATGFRNRIINGDMTIDQRNSGASINNTSGAGLYSVDRWNPYGNQASKYSIQQNAGAVTPPAGFNYYLGITSLSAYTVGAGEEFSINQAIEGYNVADLDFGNANAKTITLSFWVRSSLTGTFGGAIRNSAGNRSYPYSYTISSANTWEKKSITITGDTTGTWLKTNGQGFLVGWSLGCGSSNQGTAGAWTAGNKTAPTGETRIVATSGATFYITGVQLEAGTSATDFEFLPIDVSLGRCQRYYYLHVKRSGDYKPIGIGAYYDTTVLLLYINFPNEMRSDPTLVSGSGTNFYTIDRNSGSDSFNSLTLNQIYKTNAFLFNNTEVSGTAGQAGNCYLNNDGAFIAFSAEL